MRRTPALAIALAGGLLLTACGSGAQPSGPSAEAPVAIATTTMLGSVLGEITSCAGATSATLMPAGADPHTFAVSSDQVAAMVKAKLVFANGLGLEEGLASALANVAADGGTVYEIAPNVDPLPLTEAGHDHAGESADAHADDALDPHVWLDVARMATAAALMGDELTRATGEEKFTECAATVASGLRATDADVRATLDAVPAERRVLVTDHHSFGYFAAAYGFEVAGVVIPGGSTDAEPSSADLAALVEVIRRENSPAIFSNTAVNSALVDAVAREAGTDIKVVPLYVGSVGPVGSGAETYATMMTTNARLIADALA